MPDISRVRVNWSGPCVVGPGITTFYTLGSPTALATALRTFFSSVQTMFPNGKLTWTFDSGGAVLDSATGELVGSWGGGTATPLPVASSNAVWANGVGARIRWETSGFLRGRRVRGASFLVPLNISAYDSDGTVVGVFVTQANTAAAALLTAHPDLIIWSRPTAAGGDGGTTTIDSGAMIDQVSWLRSRRT
jgi:hypothetical protein